MWCLDAATGKELWKHSYAAPLGNKYFEGGTTGTPTIDGDRVFHLSRPGDFFCLELATGKVIYQKQLVTELGVDVPEWGFASWPLVEGKCVILNVGSHGTARDKATGKVVWQNGKSCADYAAAVHCDLEGTRCVALLTHRECAAVEMAAGGALADQVHTGYDTSASAPVVHDGTLLLSGERPRRETQPARRFGRGRLEDRHRRAVQRRGRAWWSSLRLSRSRREARRRAAVSTGRPARPSGRRKASASARSWRRTG